MKYLKIMGLCLVAALALSAVTVASASAAELELVNSSGKKVEGEFKGEGGKGTLETTNESKITCEKTKFKGTTKTTKEAEVTTTFTGCVGKGFKCNSEGAKTGEIITKLTAIPIYILPGVKVGLLLTILPYGTATVVLHCTALQKLTVKNGLVIPITSPGLNTLSKTFDIEAKQSKGKQEFTKYMISSTEAEKEAFLETEASGFVENFAFLHSGEETGAVEVEFAEKAELIEN